MERPSHIHTFDIAYDGEMPKQFTNPFCYEPHPLCIQASKQVQEYLAQHQEWKDEIECGKMFGVLVVEGGFLAAYSGQLDGRNDIPYFVPPVYDILHPDGRFQQEQAEISKMNETIRQLEGEVNMDSHPEDYTRQQRVEISALKRLRRERSEALQDWLFQQYIIRNAREEEKNILQIFKDYYRETMLRQENYEENERRHHIPSGSGDCCAPKLLQYAYLHHLKPICMAEFWLGKSPKEEVRYDGQFYPACTKKCKPILHFMLQGLDVEESFLERHNRELLTQIEVVYEDNDLVVINKPSGLLSVPSRDAQANVLDWIRIHYPNYQVAENARYAIYPSPAHRIDQDTSGLLIIAKNREALSHLQAQFYHHTVRKTYIALLDGRPAQESGCITLPLRKDPLDSPRQMVDYEHGKPCMTRYEVLEVQPQQHDTDDYISHEETYITRIAFYPETGRTHQLRMHAAHQDGLNCPIIGDKLYGRKRMFVTPSNYQSLLWPRLMLHATAIDFVHPITGQPMHIECPAPF